MFDCVDKKDEIQTAWKWNHEVISFCEDEATSAWLAQREDDLRRLQASCDNFSAAEVDALAAEISVCTASVLASVATRVEMRVCSFFFFFYRNSEFV